MTDFFFVLAQQAVVDEDAGELRADRLIQAARRRRTNRRRPRGRRSRGRLPTRSRTWRDRLLGEIAQPPGARAAADVRQKVGQDRFAVGRVRDFGMKLQAVERPRAVLHGGDAGRCRCWPAARNRSETASTWSPWLIQTSRFARHAGEQVVGVVAVVDRAVRAAELADRMALRRGRRAPGTSAACRSRCRARGCRGRRSPGRTSVRPRRTRWPGRRRG